MILPGAQPFFLPGGKTGVLLIHGFTGVPAELLPLGEYLHERMFTVLGVRLPGHGTSPEDLEQKNAHDWLNAVRDGYAILSGCTDQIVVIGHSMGGLCALLLSVEAKVSKIVTLAAPIFIHAAREIDKLPPRSSCVGQYIPKMHRHFDNVAPIVNKNYRKMPLMGVHEILDMIENVKDTLPKITAPLLVVHGLSDHTADPCSAEYIINNAHNTNVDSLLLDGVGHLIPLVPEREMVFERVINFLRCEKI